MRDHSSHRIATRAQAVNGLLERCNFHRRVEEVDLWDAFDRVLAGDVFSELTLPNKPTSRMDAIAVHFDDFAHGMPDTHGWRRGREFEFCNTGIAMPDGFDTAIRIEDVEVHDDGTVRVLSVPHERGEMTSPVGALIRKGTLLARRGARLTPTLLALFTQGGVLRVPVVVPPTVVFIPTGNELVDPCAEPPHGKNVDSNSIMICGKLAAWGAHPVRHDIIPDDRAQILSALEEAAATADFIVVNAGSSKGSDDWTIELLEEYGEVLNHETDQGPGRHSSSSIFHGTPVVGISGPPVGAEFTADWFLKPVIDAFLGVDEPAPPVLYAYLTEDVPVRPRQFNVIKRVRLFRDDDGYLMAEPLPMESPILKDCDRANAFLVLRQDCTGYQAGDMVEVELRWPYSMLGV